MTTSGEIDYRIRTFLLSELYYLRAASRSKLLLAERRLQLSKGCDYGVKKLKRTKNVVVPLAVAVLANEVTALGIALDFSATKLMCIRI